MKSILFTIGLVFCLNALAFITPYDSENGGCTYGRWTQDLKAAKEKAKSTGRFYLVAFTKSGGCSFSKNAATYIFNTEEFLSWSKKNLIPIVYAECQSMNAAATEFADHFIDGATGIPIIGIIDGQDGTTAFSVDVMHANNVRNGTLGFVAPSSGCAGVYLDDLNLDNVERLVSYGLNKRDDTPVSSTTAKNYYAARATSVTPDEKNAKNATVNGLLGTWGVNQLNRKNYYTPSGSTFLSYTDDRQDWYSFKAVKNQGYVVRCPTLKGADIKNGYFGVYTNAATAKLAAKSYENAKANAYRFDDYTQKNDNGLYPMTDLADSSKRIGFRAPFKGTCYFVFVRKPGNAKEDITINYTFTIQKADLDAFEFDKAAESFDEYDKTKPGALGASVTNDYYLTVCRDTAGSTTTASITIADGTGTTYGTDYFIPSASGVAFDVSTMTATVEFGASDMTAKLPFKVISKYGVWTGDRTFTAKIAKDAKSGSSITTETVTIKEVDAEKDADDPANDTRSGASILALSGVTLTNRLNGVSADGYDDQMDWFQFTGRDVNKVACFRFKPLVKSYSKNSFVLKFFKGSEEIDLPRSTEVTGMDAFTVAIPPKFFVADAKVYLCVSNKTAKASHCGVYEISTMQIDQPVVEFGSSVSSSYEYPSPNAASNISYSVTLDKRESSPYYADWQDYLPSWCTVDGTAKNRVDFDGTDGKTLVPDTSGTLASTWSLKDRGRFVPRSRSFTVKLLPDEWGYYMLGAKSNITVTIKGDDVNGAADRSPDWSSDVGRTFEKATTGIRNLSYTNTVDEIYFTNIKAGKPYVLGAEIVQEKNPNDQSITVSVWTNGYVVTVVSPVKSGEDESVPLMTNKLGIATNCCDAMVARLGENPEFKKVYDENGVATNRFCVQIVTNILCIAEYGKLMGSEVTDVQTNRLDRKNNQGDSDKTVKIYYKTAVTTNDLEWFDVKVGPFNLTDISVDVSKMPLLSFAANGTVKVRVSRSVDEDVLTRYKIKMTQWLMDEDLREDQTIEDDATNTVTYTDLKPGDAYELVSTTTDKIPSGAVVCQSVYTNVNMVSAPCLTTNAVVGAAAKATEIFETTNRVVFVEYGEVVSNADPVVVWTTNLVKKATATNFIYRTSVSTNAWSWKVWADETGKTVWTDSELADGQTTPVIQPIAATDLRIESWIAWTNQEFKLGPYPSEKKEDVVLKTGNIYLPQTNALGVVTNYVDQGVVVPTNCNDAVKAFLDKNYGEVEEGSLEEMIYTAATKVIPSAVTNEWPSLVATEKPAPTMVWYSSATNWFAIDVSVTISNEVTLGTVTKATTNVVASTAEANGSTAKSWVRISQSVFTNGTWRVPVGAGDETPYAGDVSATYSLGLTDWARPEVAFTQSAWIYDQTNATLKLKVARTGGWQLPATVAATTSTEGLGASVWAARPGIDFTELKNASFTIDAMATNGFVSVENLIAPNATNIWVGDRALRVTFAVPDSKFVAGAVSDCLVTLKSVIPEYEEGDTADETTNNPMIKDEPTVEGKSYARTMNGADKKDCFWITNVVAGTTYRFRLEYQDGTTNNLVGTGFDTITFTVDGTEQKVKVSDILNANYDVSPSQDGTIKIRIDRSGDSTAAKPISLGYTLQVREWPWPTFAFATDRLDAKNMGEATNVTFKIVRAENWEGTNWVKVTLAALTNNAVSATSPAIGTTEKFVFLPEQTETNWTVSVVSSALTPQGVWTGDWAFQAKLTVETDETKDKVRLGSPSNCVVTVSDVIAERDWHDACGDDDWQTLTTNETITPLVKTLPECRLNGSDYTDWYCFTGIESNATYYIECTVGKTNNLSKSGVTLTYFHYSAEGTWEELTPKATGAVTVDSDNDLYVCVSRQVRGEKYHVSAAYTLSFHRVSAGVYLTPGAVKVNENMNYATVEVVCTNTADLVLPVVAVICAETQPGDTAISPSDYEAICVTNIWEEGPVGGARTIKIPLTNRDTTWEGDETFHVRLTVESGAEGVHLPELGLSTNVLVTVEEKNAPQYGTVAITEAGEPLASVKNAETTLWPAREGDTVRVRLKRRGGVTGQVVLKWYWKDSAGTTVKYDNGSSYFYTTNFLSGEKGYGVVLPVPVPVKSGALVAENWTLAYKIDTTRGVPATVYKGSPTALNFIVTDQYYGDTLDSYSAGDRSKVAFSATGETWFKGLSDGVVRSTTPASGSSVAMTAKVTGPGTLKFGVTFTEVVAGYLKVTGGDASVTVKADGLYSVHVSAGTKTLTFTFKRSNKDGANAAVAIGGVTFVPDDAFNRYGTFTGPVSVDGVAGLATLTVSSAGKTSGKLQCADRVWTFSSNGAWNAAGAMSVTAKSGKLRKNVAFLLDDVSGAVTNGASDGVALELARKVWSDKPVAADRVELLTKFVGRYAADLAYTEVEEKLEAGALAIRLAKGGTVTVAGTLSDGTAVSASVPLGFTQESIPWAYLFAAPSDYKKGWFALPFGFVDDMGTLKVGRLPTLPVGMDDVNWKSKAKDAAFERVVVIE